MSAKWVICQWTLWTLCSSVEWGGVYLSEGVGDNCLVLCLVSYALLRYQMFIHADGLSVHTHPYISLLYQLHSTYFIVCSSVYLRTGVTTANELVSGLWGEIEYCGDLNWREGKGDIFSTMHYGTIIVLLWRMPGLHLIADGIYTALSYIPP